MRRFERAAPFCASVVALFLSTPCVAQGGAGHGAQIFVEKCSACHSVGGGDLAGPDLIRAKQLSPTDERAAVKRMEANVGPLPAGEVEALVALLKDPQAAQLIASAQNPPATATVEEVAHGSPPAGRRLFYGEARFRNGGAPCFACHTVSGRGGTLAADLTLARKRLSQSAVVSATAQPAFAVMKAAYANHAVTAQESLDLSAFLEEAGAAAKPGAQPQERMGVVHGVAAGAAVVVLAGVGLILRTRRAGVRSRMVHRSGSPGGA